MIGVFSKLLYILTLSPFSSQNGLLENPKLGFDGENQEFSDSLNKIRREMRSSKFSLRDTKLRMNFGRNLDVERQNAEHFMMTPLQELAMSSVGVFISGLVLIESKNQTIVFFIIFSLGAYTLAVLISIIELLLESEDDKTKTSWLKSFDLDTKLRNMGSAILIVTVIFQVYYYFYPPPTSIYFE